MHDFGVYCIFSGTKLSLTKCEVADIGVLDGVKNNKKLFYKKCYDIIDSQCYPAFYR